MPTGKTEEHSVDVKDWKNTPTGVLKQMHAQMGDSDPKQGYLANILKKRTQDEQAALQESLKKAQMERRYGGTNKKVPGSNARDDGDPRSLVDTGGGK
jgi:hypothetical protein